MKDEDDEDDEDEDEECLPEYLTVGWTCTGMSDAPGAQPRNNSLSGWKPIGRGKDVPLNVPIMVGWADRGEIHLEAVTAEPSGDGLVWFSALTEDFLEWDTEDQPTHWRPWPQF